MGILFLAGITGYLYGINTYKANETITKLSLYAIDISSTQMIDNEEADV